jgi:predicted hotdog family 3-hydroxylacyl-ACP dehydratase
MIDVHPAGIIEKEELLNLLPHRDKMFLLSRIVDYDLDARKLKAEYDITEDCLFYDPHLNGVPSWVSFEFMAQCVAAITGLEHRRKGEPVKLGFILSVSGLELARPVISGGETVTVTISEDVRVDAVYTFNCEVSSAKYSESPGIARAKLTVYDVEDLSQFLKENHAS